MGGAKDAQDRGDSGARADGGVVAAAQETGVDVWVKVGGCMCRSPDDYGVNGGATTATGGVVATLGWGRMMSMEE